jgi:anti-sigma B factor antagonist
MRISERQIGNVVVVDLVGSLVGPNPAGAVENAIRRHGRTGTRTVVVNLARVRSMDLTGLSALVDGYRTLREAGGEVRLAALTQRIHDLVVITRLVTVFDTFDSVEQAVQGAIPASAPVATPVSMSEASLGMIGRFLRRA